MTSRWLGELPEGWRHGRLDQVATAWTSNVDKLSVAGQVPVRLCNYTDVYKNDAIVEDMDFMTATATPDQVERFRLRHGDTLITKDSETADDIGVPSYVDYEADDLVCGYHLAIVRPTDKTDSRYLYWVMSAEPTLRQWAVLASGVTRVGIRSHDIGKVVIPLPSREEQRRIARYLDHETAQIDTLIAEQERLIDLLRERRLAVATDVVGSRIGTGERLKWLLTEIDDRAGERASYLPLMSVSISWGVRRRDEGKAETRADNLQNYKVCRAGDLVINRMRAFQGALGLAPDEGIVSPDYAVTAIHDSVDAEWLAGAMKTADFVAQMAMRVKGIGSADLGNARTPRINMSDLGEIRVDVPARSLQAGEARSVRAETTRIDLLIAESERFIELARERRSALVTAAVTGQIDVRDFPDGQRSAVSEGTMSADG